MTRLPEARQQFSDSECSSTADFGERSWWSFSLTGKLIIYTASQFKQAFSEYGDDSKLNVTNRDDSGFG